MPCIISLLLITLFQRTTKDHAPWYVIPSDNKDGARLIVASILLEVLQRYEDIQEPELDPAVKANLEQYIKELRKRNK